jgi:hypothetical protein
MGETLESEVRIRRSGPAMLLPFGAMEVQPGQRVKLEASPQRLMGGPYALHVHPENELDSLLISAWQVGQENLFVAHGEIPASALRHAPLVPASAIGPGHRCSVEIRNVSTAPISVRCTLEGAAPMSDIPERNLPRYYAHGAGGAWPAVQRAAGIGGSGGGGSASTHGAPLGGAGGSCIGYDDPIAEAINTRPSRDPGRARRWQCELMQRLQTRLQHTHRTLRIDGIYGPQTHHALCSLLDAQAKTIEQQEIRIESLRQLRSDALRELQKSATPAPSTCGARRPDSGESCSRELGHKHLHEAGDLAWPQQALPSREVLRQGESERNRYLDDPDGWSAWESATDES